MLMRFWAGHVPLMSVQVILFYSKANYKQYSFSILFIVVTLSYCPLWEEISTLMVRHFLGCKYESIAYKHTYEFIIIWTQNKRNQMKMFCL